MVPCVLLTARCKVRNLICEDLVCRNGCLLMYTKSMYSCKVGQLFRMYGGILVVSVDALCGMDGVILPCKRGVGGPINCISTLDVIKIDRTIVDEIVVYDVVKFGGGRPAYD